MGTPTTAVTHLDIAGGGDVLGLQRPAQLVDRIVPTNKHTVRDGYVHSSSSKSGVVSGFLGGLRPVVS